MNLLAIHFIQARKGIDAPCALQFPHRLLVNPLGTLLGTVPDSTDLFECQAASPELDDFVLPPGELGSRQDVSEFTNSKWIVLVLVDEAGMSKGLPPVVGDLSLESGFAEKGAFLIGRDCQVVAWFWLVFVVIFHCIVPKW